jgi:hypothetical protein
MLLLIISLRIRLGVILLSLLAQVLLMSLEL